MGKAIYTSLSMVQRHIEIEKDLNEYETEHIRSSAQDTCRLTSREERMYTRHKLIERGKQREPILRLRSR